MLDDGTVSSLVKNLRNGYNRVMIISVLSRGRGRKFGKVVMQVWEDGIKAVGPASGPDLMVKEIEVEKGIFQYTG